MSPAVKELQIRNRLTRVERTLFNLDRAVYYCEFGEDGNIIPKSARDLCLEAGRLVKALAAARMIAPDIAKLV